MFPAKTRPDHETAFPNGTQDTPSPGRRTAAPLDAGWIEAMTALLIQDMPPDVRESFRLALAATSLQYENAARNLHNAVALK
jgi:hypothetical protein